MIASRILTARVGNADVAVPISIATPFPGDGFWECQFEIGWPEGKKQSRSRGFDSIQAVYNALQAIAVYLYASPYHAAGTLRWDKPGSGYGFPMPKVGYDDLVGEDRIAQVPD
ncbi:MAG: hypothetical protein KJ944_01690 [Alphaproteobacteria bacterium]|nr:hypothetical protein [Alphaproteobacteria bacterium]MBU1561700.1 hypothetical protein [Alphaproteobacteria bacterium]MBU2301288.1 hypothetical protein [Alphaproteobacteria bacterium]MBU2367095.1 hypothetical protein [Alphaproteobacteria bacterium]